MSEQAAKKDEATTGTSEDVIKARVAETVQGLVPQIREEALRQARAEAATDPTIAGAKLAMDKVKETLRAFILPEDTEIVLAAKDKEIAALRETVAARDKALAEEKAQSAKLAKLASKAAYTLHVERTLAGNPDADLLKAALGDVARFENKAALDVALGEVIATTKTKRDLEAKEAVRLATEAKARNAEMDRLKATNQKLTEALQAAVSAGQKLAVRVHTEGKLGDAANPETVRKVVESAAPTTVSEADALINTVLDRAPTAKPTTESARANARRLAGSGARTTTPLSEEAPPARAPAPVEQDYNGLGVSLESIKEMVERD